MSVRRINAAILFSLLLLLSSCSGQASEQQQVLRVQSGQNIRLLTTTDTHYLSPRLTDNGPAFSKFMAAGDGKQLAYSDEMLDALEFDIGIQRPAAVIISGDLTNNGEKASHQDLAEHLRAIEQHTGTQIYVIPGNHDVMNPWARRFKGERQIPVDSVTPRSFRSIYSEFGYGEALLRDNDSLSYLAAPSEDLWLLMLDTSQYSSNKKLGHPQLDGQLTAATLGWIGRCSRLAAESGAQIVAVMHHSLQDHSDFLQEGFTLNNNKRTADVLMRNGITMVFSGHIHFQDIRESDQGVYDIAGSALSVYPHQYGIVDYTPVSRTLEYNTSKLNVELWARAAGSSNPDLLNFTAYSEEAFRKLSADRSFVRLSGDSSYADYTQEQLRAMADVVGRLNEIYFAGNADKEIVAVTALEGFRLWHAAPYSGLKSYVLRMSELEQKDNNHFVTTLPLR
ncbi:metallophosphoesterase [Paenibacillus sp. FSL R7-0345]|uniref:metallophosphoesterase n=1 Tax=Paenibacillus sp. FSL R7-0345 TaxID=2954535 RepID=UPI00315AD07C